MKHLAGISSYSLAITHGELGTGNTAPAESDTALTTAADRQTITLLTVSASEKIYELKSIRQYTTCWRTRLFLAVTFQKSLRKNLRSIATPHTHAA
jgi:hypothetical protein